MSKDDSAYRAELRAARETECRTVRSGTLGYQQCWRPKGHKGVHKSQDGKSWRA